MKAANDPPPLPVGLAGPTAAVLVALAGAALVAVGLLLVGAREAGQVEIRDTGALRTTFQAAG